MRLESIGKFRVRLLRSEVDGFATQSLAGDAEDFALYAIESFETVLDWTLFDSNEPTRRLRDDMYEKSSKPKITRRVVNPLHRTASC